MINATISEFDKTVEETNALLKDIEAELSWEGQRLFSYRALRAVLHTLRNRLSVEESAEFTASLPMLVRGLYYSEWLPKKTPEKLDKMEFFEEIADKMGIVPAGDDIDVVDITRSVLLALRIYISKGELEDIAAMMPADIKPLIREVI